jgi:nucleoside-diphosphate-sugar epimerase
MEVIVIAGATGFVGNAVAAHAEVLGHEVRRITAPRCSSKYGSDPILAAVDWQLSNPTEFEKLIQAFDGASAVVNTAGLALPTSKQTSELWGANAVLPAILLHAVVAACGRTPAATKFVHVSSAAVLGDSSSLHESPVNLSAPAFSPYSRSKAAGEMALLSSEPPGGGVCIYRPASVLGPGRPIVASLSPKFPIFRCP